MKTADIKTLAQAYLDVLEGKKPMDPVNKDALKGSHAQRKDGDLDNDGDEDKSDEYLHKRRQAITKNVKEATEDNPANYQHLCAKQVTHESWGAGDCIATMHAEATADGHVEWYDVMFEHGIERQVPISELKVVHAESHMHSKKSKKMSEAEGSTTPCPKCEGSMENHDPDCPTIKKEGWDDMMKMVKDKQKEKGTGNFDKKKVSTGTVYQRKANKDGSSKGVKEAVDWKVFRRIMEKQDQAKGAAAAEPIDSKASQSEKDFVAKHGGLAGTDSGIDGAKAAADTAKNIAASVKAGPKRPGDETIGDKTTPTAK